MSVIAAEQIERAVGVLQICERDILTPLALDRARELGVRIERRVGSPSPDIPRKEGVSHAVAGLVSTRPETDLVSGALYRRSAPVAKATGATAVTLPVQLSAQPGLKAAIIGAGHVGAMTALRLAETSRLANVALVDIVPGLAAGLALDMWHSAGLRGFTTRISGSSEFADLGGADYVVITAGKPRRPGMSRTDLTGVNAEIVTGVAQAIKMHAPAAVVVVVTNPLEEMTHLTAKVTGFPPERVIGMAGVLDSARFCALVGLTGVATPSEIHALALGSHGAEMVIPLSQATARGVPLDQLLQPDQLGAIVERTRDSGAEVVKLLQQGSAYFCPAESAAAMIYAMISGSKDIVAACVQSRGAYGLADTRVGLPVRLDRAGVGEIVELPLRPKERAALREAAERIAARIKELG
jgi:malate dehydrogenase